MRPHRRHCRVRKGMAPKGQEKGNLLGRPGQRERKTLILFREMAHQSRRIPQPAHARSRIMGDLDLRSSNRSAVPMPVGTLTIRSAEWATNRLRRNAMKNTALKVLLAAAVLIPLAVYAQP